MKRIGLVRVLRSPAKHRLARVALLAAALALAAPGAPPLAQPAPVTVHAPDGPTLATREAIAAAAAAGETTLTIELVGLAEIQDEELVALIEAELTEIAAEHGFEGDRLELRRCQEMTCP